MIYLISSILASSFIFVIFKLFPKYKIDTLQAIVFNYFVACIFGIYLFSENIENNTFTNFSWLPYCILCSFLFISLFFVIGKSSQKNGVALTSVSLKMSLAMTMFLMILINGEPITLLKITGIILAISGVVLMSWNESQDKKNKPVLWMLIFLFLGCGALDIVLNFTQNNLVHILPTELFSAFGLGFAGIIGSLILSYQFIKKKSIFAFRNIIAGVILGIPNYFSIYLLMKSYTKMENWSNSTVLSVTNVSVVLLSAFFGFVLFKEQFTKLKAFGLIVSLAAIILLYLSNI
jgi:drug/metabolite transporter (DMT)-like permease